MTFATKSALFHLRTRTAVTVAIGGTAEYPLIARWHRLILCVAGSTPIARLRHCPASQRENIEDSRVALVLELWRIDELGLGRPTRARRNGQILPAVDLKGHWGCSKT